MSVYKFFDLVCFGNVDRKVDFKHLPFFLYLKGNVQCAMLNVQYSNNRIGDSE